MSNISRTDNIVVTGGTGFLGRAVVSELEGQGYTNISAIGSSNYDLRSFDAVEAMYNHRQPDVVVHLAATVGGIGANKENPGRFMYENLVMGTNLIELGRHEDLKKFIMVGTVCAYPKFTPVPFKEEDIWNGYPEETNAPYGIAKKALMQLIISYKEQYGFNGINLIPVNMYGPHDHFDPKISHVIPALILKFHQAMQHSPHAPVSIWGTGSASREFLYVDDCAEAIVKSIELHNDPQPINIGTGQEITIKDLSHLVAEKMGYENHMIFDITKPDGQPRRCLNTDLAQHELGFVAKTSFDEGIERTIGWFKDNYDGKYDNNSNI
jgi:GDP-L-fucose synthase